MFLSVPKHTKPVDKTNRIALGTAAGAGHRCGADGGVVFDVGASKMWPQLGQRNLVKPRNIVVILFLVCLFCSG